MLFDSRGRLLLQQRAMSKVTFPGVWTNTVCSHPLYGQEQDEVDPPRTKKSTEPLGVQRAAVRKLQHELGVAPAAIKDAKFKYMGRVHYWAADTLTHGPHCPWGEHEIDYLLLVRLPKPKRGSGDGPELPMEVNPEEVMAVDWVDAEQLKARMADPSLRWSPWFRIIAERWMHGWWADLDKAWKAKPELRIFRFDALPAHRKGDGSHDGPAASELGDLCAKEDALECAAHSIHTIGARVEPTECEAQAP